MPRGSLDPQFSSRLPITDTGSGQAAHVPPSRKARAPPAQARLQRPPSPADPSRKDTERQHLTGIVEGHHLALQPLLLAGPARHLAAHTEVFARGRHLVSGPGGGGTPRASAALQRPPPRGEEGKAQGPGRGASRPTPPRRARPTSLASSLLAAWMVQPRRKKKGRGVAKATAPRLCVRPSRTHARTWRHRAARKPVGWLARWRFSLREGASERSERQTDRAERGQEKVEESGGVAREGAWLQRELWDQRGKGKECNYFFF